MLWQWRRRRAARAGLKPLRVAVESKGED